MNVLYTFYGKLYSIEFLLNEGLKPYKIDYKLNRNPTSVYRLLAKYSKPDGTFDAGYCVKQKKEIKSYNNSKNKTKKISKELGTGEYIGKDTIYKFIYTKYPELVKKYFRRKGKKYISHRGNKYQIMDRVMIDKRPEVVDKRERIGDWEGDTIVGKRGVSKDCLVTHVERKTGYLLYDILPDKTGNSVLETTIILFKDIP